MALISYTQFIGIRMAENGSNGFITNSTSYSMLVVYANGAREIVEGSASDMRPLLPYLKEDNIAQILQDSMAQLEQKLEALVDTRIERIFAVNHPIPDVKGMREDEAVAALKAAGFQVKLVNQYPEGTPNGIVKSYQRENENYLTVLLDVRHELPNVVGMREDEAVEVLKQAGFRITMVNTYAEGTPLGKVFACTRSSDKTVDVSLDVRHDLPDVMGKTLAEGKAILEAAGFIVQTMYRDQFNMDYRVVEVGRADPRRMNVVLHVSSQVLDVKGLILEEAKKLVEKTGAKVTVIKRNSDTYAAGYVCDWECNKDEIVLHVSCGNDNWEARNIKGKLSITDGTYVDFRNLAATYSNESKSVTITFEIMHNSKNKYIFGDYCNVKFDHQSGFNRPDSNLFGVQLEGERWQQVRVVSAYREFDKKKPEVAEIILYSSYGVFKKEAVWHMKFDLTW